VIETKAIIRKTVISIMYSCKLLIGYIVLGSVSSAKVEFMKFKENHLIEQYENSPALLKVIVRSFECMSQEFGVDPVITRITDRVKGESGVHPANRAIDIRSQFGGASLYTDTQILALVNYINAIYMRKDNYHTIIHHSFNGGPYHFHIQIPSHQTDILTLTPICSLT
jgi:hypothetical protein